MCVSVRLGAELLPCVQAKSVEWCGARKMEERVQMNQRIIGSAFDGGPFCRISERRHSSASSAGLVLKVKVKIFTVHIHGPRHGPDYDQVDSRISDFFSMDYIETVCIRIWAFIRLILGTPKSAVNIVVCGI